MLPEPFKSLRSPVPGDRSGRPGDGRLPSGALRRAMPAVHASVQKRRWRRALPAVTQTYTELPASWPTLFWGSLSQDPLSAALLTRRRPPAPVRRPLRCAETPTSGSGGVARRGCSERGPRSTSVYTCTYTQQKISRGERHRAADVACGRLRRRRSPRARAGRPASPPSGTRRLRGRLLPSGLPTVTRSSGPSLPHTYTVRTAR